MISNKDRGLVDSRPVTQDRGVDTSASAQQPLRAASRNRIIRLIVYTASIKRSHVNTFHSAALALKKDYKRNYTNDLIKIGKVDSGRELVKLINDQASKSILSLDVISHGNAGGIHIARKLKKAIPSGSIQRYMHLKIRQRVRTLGNRRDPVPTEKDAEMQEESMHGLYSGILARKLVSWYYNQEYEKMEENGRLVENNDASLTSNIDFEKFHDRAYIEFHGCKTAEIIPYLHEYFSDNFAKDFSDNLSEALVVGHVSYSAPRGSAHYKHGRVRCYRNGEIVFQGERSGKSFPNSSTPHKK